jgi:hypothetical protein
VRDDLDCLAEVVAATLGGEHRLIDRTGGGIRTSGETFVDEALVVTEVEVGLASIVGDEDLAMLIRIHRAGIDVDVRVKFLHGDSQATHFEESTQGARRQTLSEGAHYSSRHEYVLGHSDLRPSPAS